MVFVRRARAVRQNLKARTAAGETFERFRALSRVGQVGWMCGSLLECRPRRFAGDDLGSAGCQAG